MLIVDDWLIIKEKVEVCGITCFISIFIFFVGIRKFDWNLINDKKAQLLINIYQCGLNIMGFE
jgi:hypothetical protein